MDSSHLPSILSSHLFGKGQVHFPSPDTINNNSKAFGVRIGEGQSKVISTLEMTAV